MINLLYCGNDKVFDGMLISLLSIIKYVKKQIAVYVMTMDLRDINSEYAPLTLGQMNCLEDVLKEVNKESKIHLIDISDIFRKEMFDSPNLKTNYTPYTLVRLFADMIKEIPDKILYLDTDTIAKGDIEPIFEIDITDYEFAGVIDYLGKTFINPRYMNAGILYLNLKRIREKNLFKRARKLCKEKKMWFPDQTALNKLVDKKLFIPTKYNEQRKLREDTVIQHFCKSIRWLPFFHTVNVKPWQVELVRNQYKIDAYDDVLDDYLVRINEMRKC